MQQEETLLHAAGGKDVAEFLTSKVDVVLNALNLVCACASTFLYSIVSFGVIRMGILR